MPLTPPVSIELGLNEDARQAVVGSTITPAAGKVKIFLGDSIEANKALSVTSTLRSLMRFQKANATNTNLYYWGGLSDSAATFSQADVSGAGVSDVALAFGVDVDVTKTHLIEETFKQLINIYIEKTTGN